MYRIVSTTQNGLRPPRAEKRDYPRRQYHSVCQLLHDNALDQRIADEIEKWTHRYDALITSRSLAQYWANVMLEGIKDPYASFQPEASFNQRSAQNSMLQSVPGRKLSGDIGYLKIVTFQDENVHLRLKETLASLGSIRGLVIDLRSNPGGLLYPALKCLEPFLEQAELCRMETRATVKQPHKMLWSLSQQSLIRTIRYEDGLTRSSMDTFSRNSAADNNIQIAVLVNRDSGSVSEMFAGALRDNDRAQIVGKPTSGKGVFQKWFHMPQGMRLTLTMYKALNPSGRWVGNGQSLRYGVIPHHDIDNFHTDNQLAFATRLVNEALKH